MTLIAHLPEPTAEYGVPADQRLHLTIVDVRGETVVIEVYGPKSPDLFAATVTAAQSVIDTLRW